MNHGGCTPLLADAGPVQQTIHGICILIGRTVDKQQSLCVGTSISCLPADQIVRLQRVQNNAARLVLKKRRRDHVTPLLKELHWLPVKFRCQYKIATLAYRHFEWSLPLYRSSSLCTYEPSRSLRSSSKKLLKIPKRNLKSFGQRSFSFMAPSLWNYLPATLKNVPTLSQFKSQLKTLFAQAFL